MSGINWSNQVAGVFPFANVLFLFQFIHPPARKADLLLSIGGTPVFDPTTESMNSVLQLIESIKKKQGLVGESESEKKDKPAQGKAHLLLRFWRDSNKITQMPQMMVPMPVPQGSSGVIDVTSSLYLIAHLH